MIDRFRNYLLDLRDRQRISIALARGAAMMNAREIDSATPSTWEFSGCSQNGEDGVLDVLRRRLRSHNRYFVEIGAADGIENNTAWLAIAEKQSGIMIEGSAERAARALRLISSLSVGVDCQKLFVTKANAAHIAALALHKNPDVFSLDIDGNDFYVAQAIVAAGLRPKIVVVEYNSVYGSKRSLTVEYRENFNFTGAHPSQLYYGVSISGWRTFFADHGYRFVTVERNGVNAFFVDPEHFEAEFLESIHGLEFAENHYQLRKFRVPSEEQFAQIAAERFVAI